MENFTTPVLFILFNRPEQTRLVFEEIRKAKPSRLYVAADGPRTSVETDVQRCAQTRNVVNAVDWPCEVRTLFREENLGCKNAVSEAITWFFGHEEEGIILEDDCVPNKSFFLFCAAMLNQFHSDERIMMISGTNIVKEWRSGEVDYFYSNYGGIWGWASWRRAWKKYDVNMSGWSDPASKEKIKNVLVDPEQIEARIKLFEETYLGKIDTWDYQWSFCRLINSGLSVVPSVNLISNIGFGANATHTTTQSSLSNMRRGELQFPLRENTTVVADRKYDDLFFRSGKSSWIERLMSKFKK